MTRSMNDQRDFGLAMEKEQYMFNIKSLALVLAGSSLIALPAFSQEEIYRSEASAQVFGSFVKETVNPTFAVGAVDEGEPVCFQ